ncbi:MAG: hypothetical protein AAFQ21_16060, partial [Pseudomonadota bacterium]
VDDETAPAIDDAPLNEDASSDEAGADAPESLAPYILRVIETLAADRRGLGYHKNHSFTETLYYADGEIPATGGAETMCVAAAAEILIRAINVWSEENASDAAYDALDRALWTGGTLLSLRPWIYVWDIQKVIPSYGRRYGSGTHDAVVLFGLGKAVAFADAEPGDFVNFNRIGGSGHAAVFLGFLEADYREVDAFNSNVVGFKYFSAQSSGIAGLDYRYAYFAGDCPNEYRQDQRRDCDIIRSRDTGLFSMARVFAPDHWRTEDTRFFLERLFDYENPLSFEEMNKIRFEGDPKPLAQRSTAALLPFITPLEPRPAIDFSGETLD